MINTPLANGSLRAVNSILHETGSYLQPTNFSCCQSALSNLLAHYGRDTTPQQIIDQSPVISDEHGRPFGSLTQQLATWCLSQGFDVTLHTFDFQIIDLSWAGLGSAALIDRLEVAKEKRDVRSLGKHLSSMYVQSYIDFCRSGGTLVIQPWLTAEYLYALLDAGPVHLSLAPNVLRNRGRTRLTNLHEWELDDLNGSVSTHSIVVRGYTSTGEFLIRDPWPESESEQIAPERLLASFHAAAYLCDNMLFQLSPGNAQRSHR